MVGKVVVGKVMVGKVVVGKVVVGKREVGVFVLGETVVGKYVVGVIVGTQIWGIVVLYKMLESFCRIELKRNSFTLECSCTLISICIRPKHKQ